MTSELSVSVWGYLFKLKSQQDYSTWRYLCAARQRPFQTQRGRNFLSFAITLYFWEHVQGAKATPVHWVEFCKACSYIYNSSIIKPTFTHSQIFGFTTRRKECCNARSYKFRYKSTGATYLCVNLRSNRLYTPPNKSIYISSYPRNRFLSCCGNCKIHL